MSIKRQRVSNPFRGSLPLHHPRCGLPRHRDREFQTPFEDHCHFILATATVVAR